MMTSRYRGRRQARQDLKLTGVPLCVLKVCKRMISNESERHLQNDRVGPRIHMNDEILRVYRRAETRTA